MQDDASPPRMGPYATNGNQWVGFDDKVCENQKSKLSTSQQNYMQFLGCYCEKMQLCEGQWLWWRNGLGPGFG